MGKRRPTWPLVVVLAVLGCALSVPATALAATAATGRVTNLTSRSATLNGSIDSDSPAQYYFAYGTTTGPMTDTPTAQTTSAGHANVSANINGLLPGTTYRYELFVKGSYDEGFSGGGLLTFTTLATPGTLATTGQVANVTTSSAQLNGATNTTGMATWYFQYGTTTAYGQQTGTQTIGPGVHFVTAMITGLTPRTRYHFRLVVLQPTFLPSAGADSSFVTAHPPGHVKLRSHHFKVRHGAIAIPLKCAGESGDPCHAKLSLKARGTVGKHLKSARCGSATFKAAANRGQSLHVKIGSGCRQLVLSAKHHRLKAMLKATFSGGQHSLRTRVTLFK